MYPKIKKYVIIIYMPLKPTNNPKATLKKVTRNFRKKGWDVLSVLTDDKGQSKEQKSFVKNNPLKEPLVKQNKV